MAWIGIAGLALLSCLQGVKLFNKPTICQLFFSEEFSKKIDIARKDTTKVILVMVGTRPEAVKMSPLIVELKKLAVIPFVVSTSQHVGVMLHDILNVFGVTIDVSFGRSKSASLSLGFAHIMEQTDCLLNALLDVSIGFVVVQGDTSTAAAVATASFFRGIPVAHVEAGLRTYNLQSPFPEEFNRQLISTISSVNFAPTNFTKQILLSEGVRSDKIHVVGNTVIDAVKFGTSFDRNLRKLPIHLLDHQRLVLLTCHRRENIPHMPEIFAAVLEILSMYRDLVVVFPVHPNPEVVAASKMFLKHKQIVLVEPFGFLDQMNVLSKSEFILTDSGGIQEEATALGKPCLVLRDTTERPESVVAGVTTLVGYSRSGIVAGFQKMILSTRTVSKSFPFGRGDSGGLISRKLVELQQKQEKVAGKGPPNGRSFFSESDLKCSSLTSVKPGG